MRHEIVQSFEEGSVEWMAGVDMPPTLTAFLLARIAEDEADLRDSKWSGLSEWWMPDWLSRDRLQSELDAKRRIVERAEVPPHELGDSQDWGAFKEAEDICGMLAAVYADHPDFNEAWRA